MRMGGIRVPHNKNTAQSHSVRLGVPGTVTIPMSMHIGKYARVIVQKGDTVKVGQLIGEADGFVSSNIHSSVSGTVRKIDEIMTSMGVKVPCVVIDSDGKQERYEKLAPPKVKDFVNEADILAHIKDIGDNKGQFMVFCRYMEALVAYHRYYGGKE